MRGRRRSLRLQPGLSRSRKDAASCQCRRFTSGRKQGSRRSEAGIDAELEVYEGQSHAQFSRDDRLPETREAYGEIVKFFEKHLGNR